MKLEDRGPLQPKATAPAAAPVAARRDLHHGEAAPPSRSCAKAQRGIDAWCVDYAKTITPEICNEIVDFTFIGRGEGALRREGIVLHVVNHTTYHRGHVTAMLNQLDVQPLATDLPVFLRGT